MSWNPDAEYYEEDNNNGVGSRANYENRNNRGFYLTITSNTDVSVIFLYLKLYTFTIL